MTSGTLTKTRQNAFRKPSESPSSIKSDTDKSEGESRNNQHREMNRLSLQLHAHNSVSYHSAYPRNRKRETRKAEREGTPHDRLKTARQRNIEEQTRVAQELLDATNMFAVRHT
jgi:hypothetical protein